ncbi:hypothetical protein KKC1_10600 [Calderihabitans maritimus]|uniref:Uncharacterized protein n=1 Tax=Calderihabitans maritimus TaxID=1246530 RepID=A0A1Z5HQU8_9FIRM|nr:hypothetical protein KKC1_10600 [Calderihabitans maritimus]
MAKIISLLLIILLTGSTLYVLYQGILLPLIIQPLRKKQP